MANLFGLPTPAEVRANINREIFGSIPQQYGGGLMGGANIGAASIGAGLGRMFAGQSPEEVKAQKIQGIVQGMNFGDLSDPASFQQAGAQLAGALMKNGLTTEAMNLYGKLGIQANTSMTDFRKEERKTASQAVKSVEGRASEVRSSYGKLENLAKQAKSSNPGSLVRRASINSMIANVVRLNSPGIVSETELKTYTGGQATTAALLDFLDGKGINTQAWKAGIDPSGNANPDDLLKIGGSLVLGEASPLFDMYEDARARAARADLSPRAQQTIFGESKNLIALKKLVDRQRNASAVQPVVPPLPPGFVTQP